MITDVLTIGPGADPNNTFVIDPDNAQVAFNDAVTELKAEMSANAGADLYVYPSSTGVYTFTGWAQFDIPIRLHWPAGTLATYDSLTNSAKMFRFYGSSASFSPNGSAVYGLNAYAVMGTNNSTFIVCDDNGYSGATSNIVVRDCRFRAVTRTGATTLTGCAMVRMDGEDTENDAGTSKVMTHGSKVVNNTFEFGYGPQQTDAWTSDSGGTVTPTPYGIQGLRVTNHSMLTVHGNVFGPDHAAMLASSGGRTGGAMTLDNCWHASVMGNRATNLDTAASQQGSNQEEHQYAADIFSQIKNDPLVEGAHSSWIGNHVENVRCRYAFNIEDGSFDVVVANEVGRAFPTCRAAFRINGTNETASLLNVHNINGSTGTPWYKGYHVWLIDSQNVLLGPMNYGRGDNVKAKLLAQATTSSNVIQIPYDAIHQTFLSDPS